MVECRSNVLVPSETSGKAVEQYPPTANECVPIWAVELYNRFTVHLDEMEAIVSESISKSVNVYQEVRQLVDANKSMISKQNTIYDQMTKGIKTLCHDVYAQYTEIILHTQIFAAKVKGGMAVIADETSQHYKNLKDTFNTQITIINSALATIAAVLRGRQNADDALAVLSEVEKLENEQNKLNIERVMARVQNTQCMEMEDKKKKAEKDLRKQ